jgi:hypothetical protein
VPFTINLGKEMSDTIEDMKALNEYRKEQRQKVADVNVESLRKLNINAIEQSKNVFRINTQFGAVMYYPPTGKWQHKGRVIKGTLIEFREWLRKQGFLG